MVMLCRHLASSLPWPSERLYRTCVLRTEGGAFFHCFLSPIIKTLHRALTPPCFQNVHVRVLSRFSQVFPTLVSEQPRGRKPALRAGEATNAARSHLQKTGYYSSGSSEMWVSSLTQLRFSCALSWVKALTIYVVADCNLCNRCRVCGARCSLSSCNWSWGSSLYVSCPHPPSDLPHPQCSPSLGCLPGKVTQTLISKRMSLYLPFSFCCFVWCNCLYSIITRHKVPKAA